PTAAAGGRPSGAGDDTRSLAYVEGDAVVAEGDRRGLRWIAFGLDPEGSDLPLRAALPVLLQNAVVRLAAGPRSPLRPFYRLGEAVRPRVPIPGGGPFEISTEGP